MTWQLGAAIALLALSAGACSSTDKDGAEGHDAGNESQSEEQKPMMPIMNQQPARVARQQMAQRKRAAQQGQVAREEMAAPLAQVANRQNIPVPTRPPAARNCPADSKREMACELLIVAALEKKLTPKQLSDVLTDLNRTTVKVPRSPGNPPGVVRAFRWDDSENNKALWIPQGIARLS